MYRTTLALMVLSLVAGCGPDDTAPHASSTGGSAGSDTGGSAGSDTGGSAGSDTGGSAGSDTGGATAEETCAIWAHDTCALNMSCGVLGQLAYGTDETCEKRRMVSCMARFDAADTGLTVDALESCITDLADVGCDDLATLPDSCLSAGPRDDGEPCTEHVQCSTGKCSVGDADGCGVCEQPSAEGEPCGPGYPGCENGLQCSCAFELGSCTNEDVCSPPGDMGDGCDPWWRPCMASLFCDQTSSTCAPILDPGDACELNNDGCGFLAGTVCDEQTQTCVEYGISTQPDEPCGLDEDSGNFSYCSGELFCSGGVCAARPADGEACDPNYDRCFVPAICVDGFCTLPGDLMCD